jgi:hypothetical protein
VPYDLKALKVAATRKYGPLPGYAWASLIVLVTVGIVWWKRRAAAGMAPGSNDIPSPDISAGTAAGSDFGGGGGSLGGSVGSPVGSGGGFALPAVPGFSPIVVPSLGTGSGLAGGEPSPRPSAPGEAPIMPGTLQPAPNRPGADFGGLVPSLPGLPSFGGAPMAQDMAIPTPADSSAAHPTTEGLQGQMPTTPHGPVHHGGNISNPLGSLMSAGTWVVDHATPTGDAKRAIASAQKPIIDVGVNIKRNGPLGAIVKSPAGNSVGAAFKRLGDATRGVKLPSFPSPGNPNVNFQPPKLPKFNIPNPFAHASAPHAAPHHAASAAPAAHHAPTKHKK